MKLSIPYCLEGAETRLSSRHSLGCGFTWSGVASMGNQVILHGTLVVHQQADQDLCSRHHSIVNLAYGLFACSCLALSSLTWSSLINCCPRSTHDHGKYTRGEYISMNSSSLINFW